MPQRAVMSPDLAALLRSCISAPADAAPRLALSDYLEETGDMTTAQAEALRDGHGEWIVGPSRTNGWGRRQAIWAFPDGSPVLATFRTGDPRTVCVFPEQRVGLVVGEVPADVSPSCRLCATPSDLRFAADNWLCDRCRRRTSHHAAVSVFTAGGNIAAGALVCIGSDGRVRVATAADTILGVAEKQSESLPSDPAVGHVNVRLI